MKTSLDRLWAPWRITYVQGKKKPPKGTHAGCIFCAAAQKKGGERVVLRTAHAVVIMNIYPYNNGHLMVAPLRHSGDLAALGAEERNGLFAALVATQKLLAKVLKPHGFNVGLNLGEAAGAGIPGHLHIHVVPRWRGDTNFMPVCGGTKVVSQSMEELYKLLRHAQSAGD